MIINASASHIPLKDESVDCVVTSPPYWGLRSYGTPPQVWGGDESCPHQWGATMPEHHPGQVEQTKWKNAEAAGKGQTAGSGQFCALCGAWRGELGLEPTPQLYVEHMVAVFREVRRVLKKTGVCWLNVGDSYNASAPGNRHPMSKSGLHGAQTSAAYRERLEETQQRQQEHRGLIQGLKPKDLVGVPWILAFALRDDGWWLRQDIIWAKKNPMPESVRDRCTRSHEYLFLLTKSAKYHYDSDAIAEPCVWDDGGRVKPSLFGGADKFSMYGTRIHSGKPYIADDHPTRNKRDVWFVSSKPYKGAHFATMPPDLIEPCILAGCPPSGVVFDPFGGSGTVGMVARWNDRRFVLLDLKYHDLMKERIESQPKQTKKVQVIEKYTQVGLFEALAS